MAGNSAGSIFVDLLLRDSKYVEGVNRARRSTNDFSKGAKSDLDQTNQYFRKTTASAASFGTAISGLAGVLAGAFSVREIVQYSDTFRRLQGQLGLVTNSSQELTSTQERLYEIAQDTRTDISATTTLYQRLTSAVRGLGISQEEVFLFTEQLNKQLITAGLSSNEASAAIFQLTQAFNKGKLDGDEFRTILESAPPILEALERSLNKTRGEILKLASDGKLAPRVLVDAVNSMADETDRRFNNFSLQVGQAFTLLNNALTQYIGTSPDVISATDLMASAIEGLAESIDTARENGVNFTTAIGGLIATYYELAIAINEAFLASNRMFNGLGQNDERIARFEARIDQLKTRLEGLTTAVGDENGVTVTVNPPPGSTPYTPPNAVASGPSKEELRRLKELESLYERNRDLIFSLDKATIDYIDTSNELFELYNSGIITYEQLNIAIKNLGDEYDKNSEKVEVWGVDIETFGKRAAENIQDAFADFLFDPFAQGLDGMLKGFVDTVRKMIAEAQAAKLAKGLFGELAGGEGSGFLGGLFGNLFGGGSKGLANPNIPGTVYGAFADGGYLPPGKIGIAGEAGAELIYGGQTGVSVFNQDQLGRGRSGNTYNIDARGADQGAVARIEQSLLLLAGPGQIEKRVANAQRRGSL